MDVSLMRIFSFRRESDGRHKRLEMGFLFADHVRRPLQGEKPGFLAVGQNGAENAFLVPNEIDVDSLAIAHLQGAQTAGDFLFVGGRKPYLSAPTVDVGADAATLAGQRQGRRFSLAALSRNAKDNRDRNALLRHRRLSFPALRRSELQGELSCLGTLLRRTG